ncbi:autotransporter outer membrane beta-barrel domain-containing protein [Stenotrophomonas rhizophila]
MNVHSLRANALCLAVAAALVATLAAAPAAALEPVIIRDAETDLIWPGSGFDVEVYDSTVTNHEDAARAAVNVSRGSLRMERTTVLTSGTGMGALSYYGAAGSDNLVHDAVIERSSFTTQGDRAIGLGFGLTTFDSAGVLDPLGQITVSDSNVTTGGVAAHAMSVAGVNAVDATASALRTTGQGAHGALMMGGTVVLRDNTTIETTGDGAHGVHARSMRWSTSGNPAVVYRADLTLADSSIITGGLGSVGIVAGYQDSGTPVGIGAQVRLQHAGVRSAQSHAVQFLRGQDNTLELSDASVLDGGDAVIFAGEAGSISRVTATGSILIGRGAQALVADNAARLDVQLDSSDVQVADGLGLAHARNGSHIGIQATGSRLQGTVQADVGASVDMHLQGSHWNAWGQSQLDQLSLRDGSVLALGAGSVGDRLTVRGDLHIDDSTLAFDSALGEDGSATDHLWVQGDTAGRGAIVVTNLGGRGGRTVDGIRLIQVDGVSGAAFQLSGRAVGGQYEYFLFKGGTNDPADGNWYLRSELQPETDPCVTDPEAGECGDPIPLPDPCLANPGLAECGTETPSPETGPDPVPVPVLRPEPGAYLANQRAALQMFAATAQDRDAARVGNERGAWAMVGGSRARYGAVANQLYVRGDSAAMQVGTDVLDWDRVGRGQVGVMVGGGRASSSSTSRLTGYSASGKVDGQMVGVYGQWRQVPDTDQGLYVGASLQHARFDNTVQGESLARERYDSRSMTTSVEVGYAFALADRGTRSVFVQPQVQLRYTAFAADAHTEANGTVIDGADADGLSSRLGVRVFGHADTAGRNRVQPFVAVNWLHDASDNALHFDGERLQAGIPKDRYEVKAGVQLQLGAKWAAWGDMAVQNGSQGYRDVAGQIGLRRAW